MKKCRPSKWVPWAFVGAGLPLLAAWAISTDGLKSDVANRALSAVSAEQPWAKIELSGRDATITGESTSAEAVAAVSKAVAETYGVRTVVTAATVVEPPKVVEPEPAPVVEAAPEPAPVVEVADTVAPALPAIAAIAADAKWPYAITGTFDQADTAKLTATVAGREYVLGRGAALTSDGKGTFTFAPAAKFAAGSYDIDFAAQDKAGNISTFKAASAIVVPVVEMAPAPAPADIVAPAAPVVSAIAPGAVWPYALTGTFDEADTKSFKATVAGREYVLGRGAALTSDGKGAFTFAPSAKFAPGTYDIDFTAQDAAGNISTMTAKAAVIVPEPAPMVVADTVAPAAPTLNPMSAEIVWPRVFTGTFDEKDTAKFAANLNGREYVLGRGAALTSDGNGTFTFAPSAKLAPGSYDIDFTAQDAAGNVSALKTNVVVPEPVVVAPPAPVVEAPAAASVINQLDLTGAPIIKGAWAKADTNTLNIAVGGKSYTLGKDANIASDDQGNWRLMPSTALADGTYDVTATTTVTGTDVTSVATGQIVVDATPPAAPTAMSVSANASPSSLTGTYDVAQSKTLKVVVPEINLTAELGAAGSPLTADAGGNWTLALAAPVAPGTYNVVVTAGDEHGRMVEDASTAEVIITAPEVVPPPPPVPYDCEAVMARIHDVFPMRFIYDKIDFAERFGVSVNQYAALLKDPRCATVKIEIAGHADERGSDGYNEDLAERRASAVRDMIVAAGVDTSRLTVASYGESQPLDTTLTEEGWAKNRRVEIKIVK
jgi:OmpA family/Bacterial Ig-like domain